MVSQEWLPRQPQAGAAGAPVVGYAGAYRVGAVAADEPPILVSDHRPEIDARHAMGAANDQGCVGQSWHRALSTLAKQQVGFQTPRPVSPMKNIRIALGFGTEHNLN